jgi:hypothetical protein
MMVSGITGWLQSGLPVLLKCPKRVKDIVEQIKYPRGAELEVWIALIKKNENELTALISKQDRLNQWYIKGWLQDPAYLALSIVIKIPSEERRNKVQSYLDGNNCSGSKDAMRWAVKVLTIKEEEAAAAEKAEAGLGLEQVRLEVVLEEEEQSLLSLAAESTAEALNSKSGIEAQRSLPSWLLNRVKLISPAFRRLWTKSDDEGGRYISVNGDTTLKGPLLSGKNKESE